MASNRVFSDSEAKEDLTPAAQVRKLYEDNVGNFSPYWDAMSREEAFIDGDRYERDHGPEQRDRRLTQIRGQEIQDTIRHVTAEMTSRARSVSARAIDRDEDADLAELEVSLIEIETKDPWKGFEDRAHEAVQTSRELRLGIVWMDWEPDLKPFGQIIYSNVDPRRAMWDAPYDPHHPMCGWMLIKRRMDVDWIHKNFKGSDWVKPDKDRLDPKERIKENVPLIRLDDRGHSLEPREGVRDNKAELWFCWYKRDYTTRKVETGDDLVFDPDDRYLACSNGCGYRSPTQGELIDKGKIERELPEDLEGCPTCDANGQNGVLVRVDRRAQEEEVLSYKGGKRLVVIAPFNRGPSDEAVYDGNWPIPKARSFPGLFIQAYMKPGKPIGESDVKYMWDQQVASDNLVTMLLQRVFEHRNYWEVPAIGMYDVNNNRFSFREDQYNVMYRDNTKATHGNLDVKVHAAPGPEVGGWNAAFQAVQMKLTQFRPSVDLGLTPESTKNIAVGTVEQLVQQGNVPIAEAKRRYNRELSKFYGVLSDYIHATYTPRRLQRLNIEGIDLAVRMWGKDMPNFDFVVEETPPFTGLEKARSEAFDAMLAQVAKAAELGLPVIEMVEMWAEANEMPRSIVRKFIKALIKAKEEAEAEAMSEEEIAGGSVVPSGTPGLGGATPPADDEIGLGIVPELVQ